MDLSFVLHTLLYHLFYSTLDYNLQNEHQDLELEIETINSLRNCLLIGYKKHFSFLGGKAEKY